MIPASYSSKSRASWDALACEICSRWGTTRENCFFKSSYTQSYIHWIQSSDSSSDGTLLLQVVGVSNFQTGPAVGLKYLNQLARCRVGSALPDFKSTSWIWTLRRFCRVWWTRLTGSWVLNHYRTESVFSVAWVRGSRVVWPLVTSTRH
jgi:hypothetical protein